MTGHSGAVARSIAVQHLQINIQHLIIEYSCACSRGRGAFGNANAVWNVGRRAFDNVNAVRVWNVGRGAFGNANAGREAFSNSNAVRNVGRGAFGNANAVRNVGRGTFGNAILNCKFEFFCEKTYCRGGSRLNRPYKYLFVGAAGTTATPTNRFVGTAWEPFLQIHDL